MKFIFIYMILIISQCKSNGSYNVKERVLERDQTGRIIKTYDGFTYSVYDTLGRKIEEYGNLKRSDDNSNYKEITDYSHKDSVIIKSYAFDDNNEECLIKDKLDCAIMVIYKNGSTFTHYKNYYPVKDKAGKVISFKLVEEQEGYIKGVLKTIPAYLLDENY